MTTNSWAAGVKSSRRVGVRPTGLLAGALLALATLVSLAVAGWGVKELSILWGGLAVVALAGVVVLTLRGFPLFAILTVAAGAVVWGLTTSAWLPDGWFDVVGVLQFIGINLAFVVPLGGAFVSALMLDARRLARAAIDEAVSGRRWWGEPDDHLPRLKELEALPSARFFALGEGGCTHLVVAGRRVALFLPTVWPNGEFSMDASGQVLRGGRLFVPGSEDIDGLAAELHTWRRQLGKVGAMVRGYLVIAPSRGEASEKLLISVAPGEHLQLVHAGELVESVGHWLSAEPYRVDIPVMERLLVLAAGNQLPEPSPLARTFGRDGSTGQQPLVAVADAAFAAALGKEPEAPGTLRDRLRARTARPSSASFDPADPSSPPTADFEDDGSIRDRLGPTTGLRSESRTAGQADPEPGPESWEARSTRELVGSWDSDSASRLAAWAADDPSVSTPPDAPAPPARRFSDDPPPARRSWDDPLPSATSDSPDAPAARRFSDDPLLSGSSDSPAGRRLSDDSLRSGSSDSPAGRRFPDDSLLSGSSDSPAASGGRRFSDDSPSGETSRIGRRRRARETPDLPTDPPPATDPVDRWSSFSADAPATSSASSDRWDSSPGEYSVPVVPDEPSRWSSAVDGFPVSYETDSSSPSWEPRPSTTPPTREPRTETASPRWEPSTDSATPSWDSRTDSATPSWDSRTDSAPPSRDSRTEPAAASWESRTEPAAASWESRADASSSGSDALGSSSSRESRAEPSASRHSRLDPASLSSSSRAEPSLPDPLTEGSTWRPRSEPASSTAGPSSAQTPPWPLPDSADGRSGWRSTAEPDPVPAASHSQDSSDWSSSDWASSDRVSADSSADSVVPNGGSFLDRWRNRTRDDHAPSDPIDSSWSSSSTSSSPGPIPTAPISSTPASSALASSAPASATPVSSAPVSSGSGSSGSGSSGTGSSAPVSSPPVSSVPVSPGGRPGGRPAFTGSLFDDAAPELVAKPLDLRRSWGSESDARPTRRRDAGQLPVDGGQPPVDAGRAERGSPPGRGSYDDPPRDQPFASEPSSDRLSRTEPFRSDLPRPAEPFHGEPFRTERSRSSEASRAVDPFRADPSRSGESFGGEPSRAADRFGGEPSRTGESFRAEAPRAGDPFGGEPSRAADPFGGEPSRVGEAFRGEPSRTGESFRSEASRAGESRSEVSRGGEARGAGRSSGPAATDGGFAAADATAGTGGNLGGGDGPDWWDSAPAPKAEEAAPEKEKRSRWGRKKGGNADDRRAAAGAEPPVAAQGAAGEDWAGGATTAWDRREGRNGGDESGARAGGRPAWATDPTSSYVSDPSGEFTSEQAAAARVQRRERDERGESERSAVPEQRRRADFSRLDDDVKPLELNLDEEPGENEGRSRRFLRRK
ncbi:hypothetical protein ABZS66_03405 [Dactylosporangium sp. NPDC005572]|uniref:hypothetical protein n=1 Tax=Dactylosporangium sp. NPDC005572 TaxID=3156889 RepID=UPI0033AA104F